MMNKEFVPYEIALELKKLGFDSGKFLSLIFVDDENRFFNPNGWVPGNAIWTPTFSQAFRFFREKYDYDVSIKKCRPTEYKFEIERMNKGYNVENYYYFIDFPFPSYEEAELKCLKKLIEIVKNHG